MLNQELSTNEAKNETQGTDVKHIKKVAPQTKTEDSAAEKVLTASAGARPPRESVGCIPVGAGL